MTDTTPTPRGVGAWKMPTAYHERMVYPSQTTDPYHHQRVRWAVIGCQRELITQVYLPRPAKLDGGFGPATAAATRRMQAHRGLKPDGILGRTTARELFRPVFVKYQTLTGIPANLLMGMCGLESLIDPGAEGVANPLDRGIAQWSRRWHPQVSDEMAFSDPRACIALAAMALRDAYDDLGGWDFAVAHHNHPEGARAWAEGREPRTAGEREVRARVIRYAELVRKNARELAPA